MGLHDHIQEKFASNFYLIIECDSVSGPHKLLDVMLSRED